MLNSKNTNNTKSKVSVIKDNGDCWDADKFMQLSSWSLSRKHSTLILTIIYVTSVRDELIE